MRNFILLFLLCIGISSFGQDDYSDENENTYEYVDYGTEIIEERSFDEDLKSKYNGLEFLYTETKPEKPKPEKDDKLSRDFFNALVGFLSTVFPYLLALIVVIIIVKSVLAGNADFWRFKKKKIDKTPLVITQEEEENIHETDYKKLLRLAIDAKDYRKATRYYYLLLLKKMNEKELITYDKDKTNSEYVFDLQKLELRKQFSYLLYIYDYVWYGEFKVDELNFKTIENEYESFFKLL
ncbi:conserved hypothetical protein [Tenacibaculum sp. 190524A05c]|uniref:hypothetical protein n=1 Tax=Tenacibaculum platacis TaxID=3137852 RepID=UPI0031FB1ECB